MRPLFLPAAQRRRAGCASRPGCGSASGRCGRCAAAAATSPSARTPSARPRVQTLVARKASPRRPLAASSSPVVSSARPYIGELSSTLPPASSSAATTPGRLRVVRRAGRLVEADVGAAADHGQLLAGGRDRASVHARSARRRLGAQGRRQAGGEGQRRQGEGRAQQAGARRTNGARRCHLRSARAAQSRAVRSPSRTCSGAGQRRRRGR